MSLFEYFTLFLAIYAVSSLLTEYDGLNYYFLKLRNKYPESPLKCKVCTSVFVTGILYGIYYAGLYQYVMPLSFVGLVILVENYAPDSL